VTSNDFVREFNLDVHRHHVWRGFPGSGKTTQMLEVQDYLHRSIPSEVISVERIHDDLGIAYGEDDELVDVVQAERIKAAVKAGRIILCDDWNVSERMYKRLSERVGSHVVHDLRNVPVDVCIQRSPEKEDLIRGLFRAFG